MASDASGSNNVIPSQLSAADFTRRLIGDLVGAVGSSSPVIPAQKLAVAYDALSPCTPEPPSSNTTAAALCASYANLHTNAIATQLSCEAAAGVPVVQTLSNGHTISTVYNETLLAWQTNEIAGAGQADCGSNGGSGCTGADYQTMLENGIDNGARYIELWSGDIQKFSDGSEDFIAEIHNYWPPTPTKSAVCLVPDGG